jgi:hypothetical protein
MHAAYMSCLRQYGFNRVATLCMLLQIFLSATLSNAREFSEWVAHLHKQPCHVVYTDFRPTPLHHFVVPVAGQGMYKVSRCLLLLLCSGRRERVTLRQAVFIPAMWCTHTSSRRCNTTVWCQWLARACTR